MSTAQVRFRLRTLLAPMAFIIACTSSEATPPSGSLTMWRDEGNLVGTFTQESSGRSVSFETRTRALPLDEGEHVDVDVRFLNEAGFPYLVELGGHAPIDTSWAESADQDSPKVDAADRAADFQLAVEALAAINNATDPVLTRAPERSALAALHDAWARADLSPLRQTQTPAGASLAATGYTHIAEIRYKGAFIFPVSLWGDHSAVLLRIYRNSDWALMRTVATSNHGTSASDSSSMYFRCSRQFARSSTVTPLLTDVPPCSTSWGVTSGTHLCNDDTIAEMGNISANGFLTWSVCSDSYRNMWAPGCW